MRRAEISAERRGGEGGGDVPEWELDNSQVQVPKLCQ